MGVHHPNSRAHTKVWVGVHGEDEQKKSEKGWKWVKVGENHKMPHPPCGRSIKTYATGNNDAPSITKYGSPVRLDAQIVALRPPCTVIYLATEAAGLMYGRILGGSGAADRMCGCTCGQPNVHQAEMYAKTMYGLFHWALIHNL